MSTVNVSDAREHLAEIVNRVAYGKERVVLGRRGHKLVAIVPIEDLDDIEAREDAADIRAAEAALADPDNQEKIPWEVVKADLGLK